MVVLEVEQIGGLTVVDVATTPMMGMERMLKGPAVSEPEPDVVVEPVKEPVAEPAKPSKKKGGRPKKVIPPDGPPLPGPQVEPEGESVAEMTDEVLGRLRACYAAFENAVAQSLQVNVPDVCKPLLGMLEARGCEATSLWVARSAPLTPATSQLTAEGWEPWGVQEEEKRDENGNWQKGWTTFWKRRVR